MGLSSWRNSNVLNLFGGVEAKSKMEGTGPHVVTFINKQRCIKYVHVVIYYIYIYIYVKWMVPNLHKNLLAHQSPFLASCVLALTR